MKKDGKPRPMERLRLDKLLVHMGVDSRSGIKDLVRAGAIEVNGVKVKDAGMKVLPTNDLVKVHDIEIRYREFVYLMLNKPAGVISATEDHRLQTVLDLLPPHYLHFKPFPVGRLDRDTEGLLLLTNDGKLAHDLLSPRKHVPKTYLVDVEGVVGVADSVAFTRGVVLDDGYVTKPAQLQIDEVDEVEGTSRVRLTITEGKFHQVKRMFAAQEKRVTYLKRLSMGPLTLDELLAPGTFRELTDEELQLLKKEM